MNESRVARSVVISSHNGPGALKDCLTGLAPSLDDQTEVIVSAYFRSGEAEALRRWANERSLHLEVIEAPEATDVPHLRIAGMRAARGDVVLLTEDHLIPEPTWLRASDPEAAVTAGAIEFGNGSFFERAVYLFEYGAFMPPLTKGQPPSGANVAYTRHALELLEPRFAAYEWEHVWHDFLAEEGVSFSASNEMSVRWCHRGDLARFLQTAHLHGRNYGARREFPSSPRKGFQLLLLPVMPFVLTGSKIIGAISRQPAAALAWLAAAPALFALYLGWCVGEGQGYITGRTLADRGWRE